MQRHLRTYGLVFEILIDDIRRAMARHYLADPAVRLSQVAGLLGYANPSSFSHALRRWHGTSPRQWGAD